MDNALDIPLFFYLIAGIGGFIFAAVFNIPARRKLLSEKTESRGRAMKYDALNFLTFYFTFIIPLGIMRHHEAGEWNALGFLTIMFIVYSVSFWVVLRTYIWKYTTYDSE